MNVLVFMVMSSVLSQVHRPHVPDWDGHWIWGMGTSESPRLDVDLHAWVIEHPGGWGDALTHRLIGHAATAGFSGVDWRLEDRHGRRLYPSINTSAVLNWQHWEADFAAFDFPAKAIAIADRCEIPFRLVANSQEVYIEARRRYPNVDVVILDKQREAKTVSSHSMVPKEQAKSWLARGPHFFRREFVVSEIPASALLTITAEDKYELYLDGELIGQDANWWRGETYDLTSRLSVGRHVLAVKVVSGDHYAGLLANLLLKKQDGTETSIVTDRAWHSSTIEEVDWTSLDYDDSRWTGVKPVGFAGIGPRFRLKEPWKNPTEILGDRFVLPESFIGISAARKNKSIIKILRVMDGSLSNRPSVTFSKLPASITLDLTRPARIREIRIYSGDISRRIPENSNMHSSLRNYRIQTYENNTWVDLVAPVVDGGSNTTQINGNVVNCHAFSPRTVSKLRVLVESSYIVSNKASTPCIIREIEVVKAYGE